MRRLVDRATRDSEGPASSGESDKHRGRRHRLPALLLASWCCMSARRGGARCLLLVHAACATQVGTQHGTSHLAKLPLPNHRNELIILRVF